MIFEANTTGREKPKENMRCFTTEENARSGLMNCVNGTRWF